MTTETTVPTSPRQGTSMKGGATDKPGTTTVVAAWTTEMCGVMTGTTILEGSKVTGVATTIG